MQTVTSENVLTSEDDVSIIPTSILRCSTGDPAMSKMQIAAQMRNELISMRLRACKCMEDRIRLTNTVRAMTFEEVEAEIKKQKE